MCIWLQRKAVLLDRGTISISHSAITCLLSCVYEMVAEEIRLCIHAHSSNVVVERAHGPDYSMGQEFCVAGSGAKGKQSVSSNLQYVYMMVAEEAKQSPTLYPCNNVVVVRGHVRNTVRPKGEEKLGHKNSVLMDQVQEEGS